MCTESSTLHNCYGSLIKGIQSLLLLGIPSRRWCGVIGRDIWGLEKEARCNLEKHCHGKRASCQCHKAKLLCSKHSSSVKPNPAKWPCSICCKGVGSNSVFIQSCNQWVHRRCSKIKGRLKADPSFKCNACTNNIITIPQDDPEVIIGNNKFEVVDSCYLGDSIGQSRSCFEATTDRVRAPWKNFHSLLLVLTNSGISLKFSGHAFSACICSVLVYASENSVVKLDDIHWLVGNNNQMQPSLLFWLSPTYGQRKMAQIVLSGEMRSNHSNVLQSPSLVVREKKWLPFQNQKEHFFNFFMNYKWPICSKIQLLKKILIIYKATVNQSNIFFN